MRLAGLTFLDPACGSGNFLTETYISLRRLENEVLFLLQRGQIAFGVDHAMARRCRIFTMRQRLPHLPSCPGSADTPSDLSIGCHLSGRDLLHSLIHSLRK